MSRPDFGSVRFRSASFSSHVDPYPPLPSDETNEEAAIIIIIILIISSSFALRFLDI